MTLASVAPAAAPDLLGMLPDGLRDELLTEFNHILANFREGRWEPAELDGGKFCEVVYSIIVGHFEGSFPSSASKPSNMVDACKALETTGKGFPRSLAIQIPRMLVALYEVRNNRGVGHVGGDVDPNHMDAVVVLHTVKWILAELVRVFHATDVQTATTAVDALANRQIPVVWEVEGKKRVLEPSLTYRDRMLLLLYSAPGAIEEDELRDWVEHPRPADFRKVLIAAHKDKLIEYRQNEALVYMSPTGVRYVEEELPLDL
jgi:hypothetical protein